jgi:hypothetical protein
MKRIGASVCLITVTLLVSFACQRKAPPTSNPGTDTASTSDDSVSVSFKLQEVGRQKTKDGDELTWLATHESKSGVARFRIRMILKEASGDPPFVFSKGAFMREKDSQPAEFLRQVGKALEAKGGGKRKANVNSLDFTVALLGLNQSRGSGPDQAAGGFTSTPPGDWIVTKVFVAEGEGEFYLNLNPKEGVGEISIKDSDYGDIVLQELARVL